MMDIFKFRDGYYCGEYHDPISATIAFVAANAGTIGAVSSLAGAGLSLAGGLKQASAIKQAGRAEQQRANFIASQNEVNAGQERASSQRAALNETRRGRLAASSATNIAAAQGGTLDTSFGNILGDLATEGKFREDSALFAGETRARQLESSALLGRFDGDNALRAANAKSKSTKIGAITNFATSLGSFSSKYAPKPEDFASSGQGFGFNARIDAPPRKPLR